MNLDAGFSWDFIFENHPEQCPRICGVYVCQSWKICLLNYRGKHKDFLRLEQATSLQFKFLFLKGKTFPLWGVFPAAWGSEARCSWACQCSLTSSRVSLSCKGHRHTCSPVQTRCRNMVIWTELKLMHFCIQSCFFVPSSARFRGHSLALSFVRSRVYEIMQPSSRHPVLSCLFTLLTAF